MVSNNYILHIGSKKYSSWSLRVWLAMKVKQIPFEENLIPFINEENKRQFNSDTKNKIAAISKTKKVPSLSTNGLSISESLTILEYLNDMHPEKQLWQADILERASARMIAGTIHANLPKTKSILPFLGDGRRRSKTSEASGDIKTELDILLGILPKMKGAYLYGDFTIADAMLIPFLMRYYAYNINVPDELNLYVEHALASAEMKAWIADAKKETEIIKETEEGYNKL